MTTSSTEPASRTDAGATSASARPATETIALTRGVPDPDVLPAEVLADCFSSILTEDPTGTLQYGQAAGYAPLRRLLAEQYDVTEAEIFVASGSLQLMDMLAAHFVTPGAGDTVLVEQPTYDRAIGAFRTRGARVIGIPLQHDGIDLSLLEAQVERQKPAFLYLIPDFQNPSGTTLSIEKRERLLGLAERHDFWLIEDVPYRLLRYTGEVMPSLRDVSLKSGAGRGRVITMTSYSKLVAPALRVGHVVAPAEVVSALARKGEDTYLTPVLPAQAALYEFLRRGLLDENIERLKQTYGPRCRAMIDAVRLHLPDATFAEPEGGFFLGLTLPPSAQTGGLIERAKDAGVLLTDGRAFFAEPAPAASGAEKSSGESADASRSEARAEARAEVPEASRFVRLPFCAVTEEQIEEGVRRLATAIR